MCLHGISGVYKYFIRKWALEKNEEKEEETVEKVGDKMIFSKKKGVK